MRFSASEIIARLSSLLPMSVRKSLLLSQNPFAWWDPKISLSQQAEDLALERYFEEKSSGFYVDVGAYHPFNYSNTAKFYQKGWRGINIEANPDRIDVFKRFRPADINLNVGVSNQRGMLNYFMFNEPAINTFSKTHAERWIQNKFPLKEERLVNTIPLSELLDEHLPANTTIDFLNIDVEDWDLYVLESNDWVRFRPTIVLVESTIDISIPIEKQPIPSFMKMVGYRVWSISGGTILFEKI